MNLLISVIICIVIIMIPVLPLIKEYKKSSNNLKVFIKKNKYQCICIIILFFACMLRTVYIDRFPSFFNQDEASIGYEAYSILNYGVDRNGISYPVHFISWGGGQNVLYGYILIPFIKLFGLNIFSVRLPMAIISCISVLVWYLLLKVNLKKFDKKFITMLVGFAFFPWMIMKSRWGLESNIFLDLILYATFFLNKYVLSKKSKYVYIASIFIGISVYSYGTSYVFVPIYCLIFCVYLLKKKYINIKDLVVSGLIVFIIVLPMVLFTVINYFDLQSISFWKITIPKMVVSRLHENNISDNSFIKDILINIVCNIFITFVQWDGVKLNSTIISLIISIIVSICFFKYFKYNRKKQEQNELDKLMFLWLIASLITLVFFSLRVIMTINRINIFLIPYLYFAIKSIYINTNKTLKKIICVLILLFILEYFTVYNISLNYELNTASYFEAIEYIQNFNDDRKIYIDRSITKEPYIYYLFYTKMDPNYYILNSDKEVIKYNNDSFGEYVNRIGNVFFYLPDEYESNEVIVTTKQEMNKFINANVKEFGNIIVLY